MRLLETIKIPHAGGARLIELYHGDLTELSAGQEVDVLVISAFPDDYFPSPSSLVGALYRKGISVERLAASKAVDLRPAFSCWMSQEITAADPGIRFKRILCFEPFTRGKPPEVVGDIFRSLSPFLGDDPPVSTVAMPLVASGDQRVPPSAMLPALIDAAAHWMSIGLPLKRLMIVERSEGKAEELRREFLRLKDIHAVPPEERKAEGEFTHDVFVSYSHDNGEDAASIVNELRKRRPGLRVFYDRLSLDVGRAWQQEIFEALDSCRKVMAVYSPSYVESKVCKEEFNIAWARGRESDEKVLFPVYLYTARLPTYMKMCQYFDCREGNREMLGIACEKLLAELRPATTSS